MLVFVCLVACVLSISGEDAEYAAGWPALLQSTASTALTHTASNLQCAAGASRVFYIYKALHSIAPHCMLFVLVAARSTGLV